jgi:hypothetical protein
MSSMRKGIWSAIAVSATFGAVQFAFGHDLTSGLRAFAATVPEQAVNRAAKANRVRGLSASSAPTKTISIRVDRLADTSVVVRIPRPAQTNSTVPAPGLIKSEDRKATVACEPVVSILTDIAKRLPPGRCVT